MSTRGWTRPVATWVAVTLSAATICCAADASGPWWLTLAAFDLFVLVCLVCWVLLRHFDARDARIDAAWRTAAEARGRFMDLLEQWQAGPGAADVLFTQLVFRATASLNAFEAAVAATPAHLPAPEPDADWLNGIRWVEFQAKRRRLL